jgi:hypothetical protein
VNGTVFVGNPEAVIVIVPLPVPEPGGIVRVEAAVELPELVKVTLVGESDP